MMTTRLAALLLALPWLGAAQAQTVGPRPGNTTAGITGPLAGDCSTLGASGTGTSCNASGAPYRIGAYYHPNNVVNAGAAGAVQSATKMTCLPGTINKLVTISSLSAVITTASSGGNVQFGLYTDSGGRPLNLVTNTASVSTTTTGAITGTLAVQAGYTGTYAGGTSAANNVQLGPGSPAGKELWWCTESDNATVIMLGATAGQGTGGAFIGSTSVVNVISQGAEISGISTNSTFGTWPASLSGATWTDGVGRGTPMLAFMVASVP